MPGRDGDRGGGGGQQTLTLSWVVWTLFLLPRAKVERVLDQMFFNEPTHRKGLASRATSQLTVYPREIKPSCKFFEWLV